MTDNHNFFIIGRLTCGWCDKAKDLLRSRGLTFDSVNIESNLVAFRLLLKKCGLTTVPQIWYGDTYIGGYEDLVIWLTAKDITPSEPDVTV